MSNLNKTILSGRLTSDPELKFSTSGQAVCEFGFASNRKYKDKEDTLFIDVETWGKTAELICEYCKKGSKLLLEGRLKQDHWEKDGKKCSKIYLVLENFEFLEKKNESK